MRGTPWIKRSIAVFMTAAAAFCLMGPQADAGQKTVSFKVTTSVQASAQLTVNNLAFASYDGTQNLFASTNLQFMMPGASPANPQTVEFGFIGTGAGNGTYTLSNPSTAVTISYDLCQDAACTVLFASNYWGNPFTVTTPSYQATLWGEIPKGQALPPAGTVMSQTIGAYMTY